MASSRLTPVGWARVTVSHCIEESDELTAGSTQGSCSCPAERRRLSRTTVAADILARQPTQEAMGKGPRRTPVPTMADPAYPQQVPHHNSAMRSLNSLVHSPPSSGVPGQYGQYQHQYGAGTGASSGQAWAPTDSTLGHGPVWPVGSGLEKRSVAVIGGVDRRDGRAVLSVCPTHGT